MLAALVVAAHIAFVLFAALGGLLVLRWRRLIWAHVPAAAWAIYVELSGEYCPLTPLENTLRARAGLDVYSQDFVARYLFPLLYPDGLTRDAQILIGSVVLTINVAVYWWMWMRRTKQKPASVKKRASKETPKAFRN